MGLSRRVALPPSKISMEANWPQQNYEIVFIIVYLCFYIDLLYLSILNQNKTNIFHLGLLQCILLLVRSQIAPDLCKPE